MTNGSGMQFTLELTGAETTDLAVIDFSLEEALSQPSSRRYRPHRASVNGWARTCCRSATTPVSIPISRRAPSSSRTRTGGIQHSSTLTIGGGTISVSAFSRAK